MNWQHLIYFKKAAEYEHLTRAAEELSISPSALSKAIASLEDELGLVLFEKNGRNIQLNNHGKSFYTYVSKAMQEIDEGIHFIQKSTSIYTGTIRLCSIMSPGSNYLPELLYEFTKAYPLANIELSQNMTHHILTSLNNNQLDLGICSEFLQENEYSGIERELLYREEIFLAVPYTHPLSSKDTVSFDDFRNETFIGYTNNTGIASTIHEAILKKTGLDFQLKTKMCANESNTITHMVSKGLGLAFVVENPSLYTTRVKLLKVTDLDFYHSIFLVWKKDAYMSPAVHAFKDFALEHKHLRTPFIRPAY